MEQSGGLQSKNKNKSLLKNTQYNRCGHVSDMPSVRLWGFPWLPPGLTYWLCGLQVDRGVVRRKSWYPAVFCLYFFNKTVIFLSGSESHILQCDASPEEVGEGRRREQQSSLVCCTDSGS